LPERKELDQEIFIDKRSTIRLLKEEISKVIGVPPTEFKIFRNTFKHEYKREDQTLEDAGLFDYAAVLIERGQPLKTDQFIVNFFLYEMNNNESEMWSSTFSEVLSSDTSFGSIKEILQEKLNIRKEFLRLRDKNGSKAGREFSNDERKLKEEIATLYDGKDFAVEKLESLHTSQQENEFIIEVQQWMPSDWTLKPKETILINKNSTHGDLKAFISKRSQIPSRYLSVARPRKYHLKDLSSIPLLAWEVDDDCLLSNSPWHMTDGDLILFKNNSEPEKVSLEILKAESEKGKEHLPSSKTNISEPTIVIRTRFDKPF